MNAFDPRITPARKDLAALYLKGTVEADRFVEGAAQIVTRGRVALHARASADSPLETELLFGHLFTVYEQANGWAWGQSAFDNCVGYVHTFACAPQMFAPDHRVTALATPLLPAPDAKRPARDLLPMNASIQVIAHANGFVRIAPDGYLFEGHLAPLDRRASDWVAIAERFVGTPYVWGGRTFAGLDCSGLVQTALEASGHRVPRDTDLQEKAIGLPIGYLPDFSNLARGDLVFWNGHVGIMLDRDRLLHATSFRMEVVVEPLSDAVRRIEPVAGPVTSVKRISSV
jgi:cell wall-associated NlpC family hydrolase